MMYSRREKKYFQLTAAAFLLGLFALNPMARAEEKDGMTLSEIEKVIPDFEVQKEGRNIAFVGSVPERCARKDGEMLASVDYLTQNGQHIFKVHLAPECEKPGFKAIPGEKLIPLSEVIGERAIKDQKGQIMLASEMRSVDPKKKPKVDATQLKDSSSKGLEHIPEAELRAQEEERTQKENDKIAREAEIERIRKSKIAIEKALQNAETQCLEGNVQGVSELLTGLSIDSADILLAASGEERKKLAEKLDGAATAKDARDIWAEIEEASLRGRWPASAMKELRADYIAKRFLIIDASTKEASKAKDFHSAEKKLAAVDKDLQSWASEFRKLESRGYRNKKSKDKDGEDETTYSKDDLAKAYGKLAAVASQKGKKKTDDLARSIEVAGSYYEKAARYSPSDEGNIQGELARLNKEALEICQKNIKNLNGLAECEKEFRAKAREHAKEYRDAKADEGTQSAEQELQAFNRDFLQWDGAGPVMNYAGFGEYHPYMPGAADTAKVPIYQNAIQQMQYAQMMQMYGGMYGMGGQQQQQQSTSIFNKK